MPECYWPLWKDNKKIGKITQQFGVYNPRYAMWGFTHHNGIDISESSGTEIHGMSGIVDEVGNNPDGYGIYVSIKDEVQQCWWTYAHLSHISVKRGQHIYTGDVVGLLGSTGSSTGNHVHVECKPFDYKAHYENGTLGRIEFSWFISIIEGEEMDNQHAEALQKAIIMQNLVLMASKGMKFVKPDPNSAACYLKDKKGGLYLVPDGTLVDAGLHWGILDQ